MQLFMQVETHPAPAAGRLSSCCGTEAAGLLHTTSYSIDCSTLTNLAEAAANLRVHIIAQGNAAMAMLVQVPLARGVAELLLHPLPEAVLMVAALPRGAAQARSGER